MARASVDRAIQWLRSKPNDWIVADLGCGDAELCRASPTKTVKNFDLSQNASNNVVVCNIAHLPLEDFSVDACVFCLSLMGTDYGAFLSEAARVLRPGGCLWIAEVTSRAIQKDWNVVPELIGAIEALGFELERKRVKASDYFFELVFCKAKVGTPKTTASFPALRACAYKKR